MPTGRKRSSEGTSPNGGRVQPILNPSAREIQAFGTLQHLPIGLDDKARQTSVELLNQILADTMALRDLYKKHHWQTAGPTFYQLHLLFDKHFAEQVALIDQLAERIQMLGGLSLAMAHDVAETTRIPRPPRGREEPSVQISRLLKAHEIILTQTRQAARKVSEAGDDGTNDLLVSDVLRTNEMHVWFLAEHLVSVPLVRSGEAGPGQHDSARGATSSGEVTNSAEAEAHAEAPAKTVDV
jgi:starvation-inducible DNA-binding protein